MTAENGLRGYTAGEITPETFRIRYQTGSMFHGETMFVLFGDGRYRLRVTTAGGLNEKQFSGEIAPEQVQNIVTTLIDSAYWQATTVPPYEPDSVMVNISIHNGDDGHVTAINNSEVSAQPGFAKAETALLNLIKELSDGEITY